MKILAVADETSPALWDYYRPGMLREYDLMISCGDLRPKYLSFLVTMGRAPLLYVRGNHDDRYDREPPEGCDCIEDKLITYNGLRILGLGGSIRYNERANQYTEQQMERRIRRLRYALWRSGGVDLVVTHAPVAGLGDGEDRAHQGFEAFKPLLDKYRPLYLLHGHMHPGYTQGFQRTRQYGDTTLINVWEKYVLEIPDALIESRKKKK